MSNEVHPVGSRPLAERPSTELQRFLRAARSQCASAAGFAIGTGMGSFMFSGVVNVPRALFVGGFVGTLYALMEYRKQKRSAMNASAENVREPDGANNPLLLTDNDAPLPPVDNPSQKRPTPRRR